MDEIKVLLVDDHPVVRSGYRRLLDNIPNIQVVAEAETGAEGYRKYVESRPDVVVMDLSLPDIGGLEVIRKILMRDSAAKILVFSVHENEILVERALEAGARGYLTKRSAPKILVHALAAVAHGEIYLDPALHGIAEKARMGHQALLKRLTSREFEVFRHLAEGRSVAEIAALLHASAKTIGVHQTRIMKKLNLSNSVQLAHIAVRAGIIIP